MLGSMIAQIRKDKNFKKSDLANLTGINIGHLSHIEKGERTPSHKSLKKICKVFDIPFQPLMYTYDKKLTDDQKYAHYTKYISYSKILAFDNNSLSFIDCPSIIPSASFAIRLSDNSMNKSFDENIFVFVELNSPIQNQEIGLFYYNSTILVRKLIYKNNHIFLLPDNNEYKQISVEKNDEFYIIGKIIR